MFPSRSKACTCAWRRNLMRPSAYLHCRETRPHGDKESGQQDSLWGTGQLIHHRATTENLCKDTAQKACTSTSGCINCDFWKIIVTSNRVEFSVELLRHMRSMCCTSWMSNSTHSVHKNSMWTVAVNTGQSLGVPLHQMNDNLP
jgi:hypothetical protein